MTPRKVREAAPLQVYLIADERRRLERLADQLDLSKSDDDRSALVALERELVSPDAHPALRLIGIAREELEGVAAFDAAREHDSAIVDAEERSWTSREARGGHGPTRSPRKKPRAR
jgi:hypothetical protein